MKNSLFALLWAIAFVPAYAQKTLPLSLQLPVSNAQPSVLKTLKRAGFDCGPKAAQQRSNALVLDSTITFHEYFAGDSTPLYRTIYQYPQPDVKIEIEAQFESNQWITLSRSTSFSDDLQRLVEVYSEMYDPNEQAFLPDSRLEAFPHGDSPTLLDSFFVYQWNTDINDWSLLFFGTNTYDNQDRLLESISSFDYLGTPLLFKDKYSYDANGDNHLVESFAFLDGVEIPSSKREITYKNHLPIESIAFVPDGLGDFAPQNRITYTYNDINLESQLLTYEWSLTTNDWILVESLTYGYENISYRLIAKETILYGLDGLETRDFIWFDYLDEENLALETRYGWDGADYFVNDRTYYYYNDGTSDAQEPGKGAIQLVISPNPSTGMSRLNLENPALVRIYNANGAMIESAEYQPNTAMNLTDLPSGLYFVTAQSNNVVYSGKLVKE